MPTERVNPNISLKPEHLRAAREKLGLTQHQLAHICGFGANQISRYEIGMSDPSGMALRKMAGALQVSVDYLMGLSDEPSGKVTVTDLTYPEQEILERFRQESWPGLTRLILEHVAKQDQ